MERKHKRSWGLRWALGAPALLAVVACGTEEVQVGDGASVVTEVLGEAAAERLVYLDANDRVTAVFFAGTRAARSCRAGAFRTGDLIRVPGHERRGASATIDRGHERGRARLQHENR